MVIEDNNETNITEIHSLKKKNAIGIGPGIGTNSKTIEAFKLFLKETNFPIVLDADALNIISLEKELLKDIPSQSVLTPHPQEFKRLVGEWNNEFERLDKQIALSKEFGITVLLKGAYSSITIPSGQVFFNSTGNSGMATAGSGDVLTGIITSLLAQGYSSEQSTILGAYLHGLSGDIYINKYSKEGLISRDLIEYIPIAIREIYSY
jgi:NAD(P)H-hydrate epimerase